MLDRPLRESPARSCAWVLLCIGLIYATIPLARLLVEAIGDRLGRNVFLYLCLLLFILAGLGAWRNLRHRRLTQGAQLCLGAVLVVFAYTLYYLREIPEEALHVAQYALLALLIYRALSHYMQDYAIYPVALLLTSMVGILDEYIQWVVPARYFDLSDIAINSFAGLLALLGLGAGLRPQLVARAPTARSWRWLGHCGAATLLLFLLSFVNTPQRVAWYTARLPALDFLRDASSMMAQYGYLHRSPAGGEFRSRFDLEALAALDRERGAEVGRILDDYLIERYPEFLDRYSIVRDPYAHEIGVRLFRRIYHLDRVRDSPQTRARHYLVAYHENEILKAFFPSALKHSRFSWDAALEAEFREAGGASDEAYLSRVSQAVITRVSETQVWLAFAAGITLVYLLTNLAARRGERHE